MRWRGGSVTGAVRTCPKCLTRVLPLDSGLCPACRGFDFSSSPSDDKVVEAARRLSQSKTKRLVRKAAVLHRRVVLAFGATIAAVLLRFYVRIGGSAFLGSPTIDPGLVATALSVGAAAALFVTWSAARELASVIALAAPGRATPNLFRILKESSEFFREKGFRVGFLGPHLEAVGEDEEGGRRTLIRPPSVN
jgi:hypothetical protein